MPFSKHILSILALFFSFSGAALAEVTIKPVNGDAWQINVFGNGEVMYNIMNALALIANTKVYSSLLLIVALIGFMIMVLKSSLDPKNMPKILGYVFAAYFVSYFMVQVRAPVMVHDEVSNYTQIIENVPSIVALPSSLISQAGFQITNLVESSFSTPGTLQLGAGAFDLGNSLLRATTQARILDPELRQNMDKYIQACALPLLASGQVNSYEVLKSNDLWSELRNDNKGMTVRMQERDDQGNPSSSLVQCPTAYDAITATLLSDATISRIYSSTGALGIDGNINVVGDAVGSVFKWMSGDSLEYGGGMYARQAAAISLMKGSFSSMAAQTNNNALMSGLNMEQSLHAQRTSWYTAAVFFKEMIGYIYSVLQVFVFALVPVLMVAALIPGFGGAMLKNYAQVLIWLILWQPLLAIVNFISASFSQQGLSDMLSSGGGLTLENTIAVTEQSINFSTAAGFMATLVPMISWGLVKGSMAFTEFISAGLGSSFASSAAGAIASNKYSDGSVSMDTASMNQRSFSMNTQLGSGSIGLGLGGLNTGFTHSMSTAHLKTGDGASATPQYSQSASASEKASQMDQFTLQRSLANSRGINVSEAASMATTYDELLKNSQSTGSDLEVSDRKQIEKQATAASTYAISTALSEIVGHGTRLGFGLDGNVNHDMRKMGVIQDNMKRLQRRAMNGDKGAQVALNDANLAIAQAVSEATNGGKDTGAFSKVASFFQKAAEKAGDVAKGAGMLIASDFIDTYQHAKNGDWKEAAVSGALAASLFTGVGLGGAAVRLGVKAAAGAGRREVQAILGRADNYNAVRDMPGRNKVANEAIEETNRAAKAGTGSRGGGKANGLVNFASNAALLGFGAGLKGGLNFSGSAEHKEEAREGKDWKDEAGERQSISDTLASKSGAEIAEGVEILQNMSRKYSDDTRIGESIDQTIQATRTVASTTNVGREWARQNQAGISVTHTPNILRNAEAAGKVVDEGQAAWAEASRQTGNAMDYVTQNGKTIPGFKQEWADALASAGLQRTRFEQLASGGQMGTWSDELFNNFMALSDKNRERFANIANNVDMSEAEAWAEINKIRKDEKEHRENAQNQVGMGLKGQMPWVNANSPKD